jgi:hypothetical protein
MLSEKSRHADDARTPWQFVQRGAALAQSDCLIIILKSGKQIAEAPYATYIHSRLRETTLPPYIFQFVRIRLAGSFLQAWIDNLEQVSAFRAAEILAGGITEISAADAAKAICCA